jgi:Zn-dependent M28 family amino/carboxypeptidase
MSIARAVIKRLIAYPLAIAILLALFWAVSIRMPGAYESRPLPPLSAAEDTTRALLLTHVSTLVDSLGPRWAAGEGLEGAARYIERTLGSYGYEVKNQRYTVNQREVRNLEVTVRGNEWPDSIVLVGAHYDAVDGTPGADDNASGTAALLDLARRFADTKPLRSIRLVAFTMEEPPQFWTDSMGSLVYARAARARADAITAMISLESIGYFSDAPGSQRYPPILGWFYPKVGDFVAVVGNLKSRALVHDLVRDLRSHSVVPTVGTATLNAFPGVGWSDHWSFWEVGYPAVMVSGTATYRNPNYHMLSDSTATLDYARLARVVTGLERSLRYLADR